MGIKPYLVFLKDYFVGLKRCLQLIQLL